MWENGKAVEIGRWSFKNQEIVLESLTTSRQETWKPTFDKKVQVMTIPQGEVQFRSLQRAPSRGPLFDGRLEGLWKTDNKHADIVEFGPQGSVTGLFWRLNEDKQLYLVGCQAYANRVDSTRFSLDGVFGEKTMTGMQPHLYSFESGRLVWGRGKARRVYRKIQAADLPSFDIPAAIATPSK